MICSLLRCDKEDCLLWREGTCEFIVYENILRVDTGKKEYDNETLIQDQADMIELEMPDNSDCTWGGGSETK